MGGPFAVKLTREELQARVELLEKKRRSVKHKAQDPPKSILPARGKTPKLEVSVRPEKFQFLEKRQNRNFGYKNCNFG